MSRVGGSSDTVANTEHLVRQILSTKPDNAVMMLSTWSLPHDYINGAHKHAIVAEYYVSAAPVLRCTDSRMCRACRRARSFTRT